MIYVLTIYIINKHNIYDIIDKFVHFYNDRFHEFLNLLLRFL